MINMARKYMTKEVTFTKVFAAKMDINEDGLPVAVPVAPIEVMGTIDKAKAQKLIIKNHDEMLTVFKVEVVTQTYKMKVSDFIKIAELVSDTDNLDEEDEDSEDEN
jgi:hypothetical protein